MIKLKPLSVLLLAGITSVSYATSPPEELQPRDLDGDPNTVEAYYYSPLNITWLADTNIGKTNTFGLQRSPLTINGREDGGEVNNQGGMFQNSLDAYLQGMNQSQYLGHSNWRLPVAQGTDDLDCEQQVQIGNTLDTHGRGCTAAEAGQFNRFLVRRYGSIENFPFTNLDSNKTILDSNKLWLGSFGRSERHYYFFGGEGVLSFCRASGCGVGYVWPVHDGDIGTAARSQACVDTDPVGDGWGWNGASSCRVISGEPPVSTVCVDTDPAGDGWGWDGATSCRIDVVEVEAANECVDSPPVGDGWGWDGATSCRIDAAEVEAANECVDSPPIGDGWGWNGVTSCRVDSVDNNPVSPVDNSAGSGTLVSEFISSDFSPYACIDSPPIGDGWGWAGFKSCRVSTDTNLIKNGNFEEGLDGWNTYVHPRAVEARFYLSDLSTSDLRFSYVDAGSEWWHSQAYTDSFTLEAGHTYRLEFTHSAGGKTGGAVGAVIVENADSFKPYLGRQDFSIGVTATRSQVNFYVAESDDNVRLTFNLGDNAGGRNSINTGTIWFENIVLTQID